MASDDKDNDSNSRYCDFSFYIVVLNQNFCFPWVIWQCLQTFLVATGGATGISGLRPGMLLNTMPRTAPTTELLLLKCQ